MSDEQSPERRWFGLLTIHHWTSGYVVLRWYNWIGLAIAIGGAFGLYWLVSHEDQFRMRPDLPLDWIFWTDFVVTLTGLRIFSNWTHVSKK
ncbi:MAG TPA: hypothetical protein VKD91_08850 [Pyrinomonadaceae bacterium]|nr:hypothetical protein [Pyrinomonadaceae bacterium]